VAELVVFSRREQDRRRQIRESRTIPPGKHDGEGFPAVLSFGQQFNFGPPPFLISPPAIFASRGFVHTRPEPHRATGLVLSEDSLH
jgi:hypothetical protein